MTLAADHAQEDTYVATADEGLELAAGEIPADQAALANRVDAEERAVESKMTKDPAGRRTWSADVDDIGLKFLRDLTTECLENCILQRRLGLGPLQERSLERNTRIAVETREGPVSANRRLIYIHHLRIAKSDLAVAIPGDGRQKQTRSFRADGENGGTHLDAGGNSQNRQAVGDSAQ